jgi:hypothetical protein
MASRDVYRNPAEDQENRKLLNRTLPELVTRPPSKNKFFRPSISKFHHQMVHKISIMPASFLARRLLAIAFVLSSSVALQADSLPESVAISSGWRLQDVAKVAESGETISQLNYRPADWFKATVPGTVLNTLVNDGVYPEPLYGENNRPDKIPESLCRTSYWYRTTFTVPESYSGRRVWLNFEGINYHANVWVNGTKAGAITGAFIRGHFDISSLVKAGQTATLAVLVAPQPHPGDPIEHTIATGLGKNGGITAIDGPTFLCTIGWDWIPGIRDRDTGIWQKVFLSASGPVLIKEPLVTTDLPLPKLDSSDITVQVKLQNVTAQPENGILKGSFGDITFEQSVELSPNSTRQVTLDSTTTPQLHLKNPKLWWPNGFGPQDLYPVHLAFEADGSVSDASDFSVGIRKITYTVPGTENLTVSVNGVRVICKGGDWGMDEAMKRNPRERLEAEIRMHQLANYTIIRNWVGQSTSEDFYELCDQYGIMVWDEFFQPNPLDGPNPTDVETYLANARDKITRFRNHPSIIIWCGRNEGSPPKNVNDGLMKLMTELEPTRLYEPSSGSGHGVRSGGGYNWGPPQQFYQFRSGLNEAFKTEIGSVSIPTLEAVHAMMPKSDWESINDDWAEHDLARGAQAGDRYPDQLNNRYGPAINLADFVRKAQLMNYEAFRAMYEARFAKMFNPVTGVITWMSNPAQPSFVWQLYSHDLEPNASLFGTRKACEPVHIMLNQSNDHLEVINNRPTPVSGAMAFLEVYNLDGKAAYKNQWKVEAPASQATDLGTIDWPAALSPVHFVKLKLKDAGGKLLSDNFYWRNPAIREKDLPDLAKLPTVQLQAKVVRHDREGKCLLDVTIKNPSDQIALMAHMQLRCKKTGERVLPVYYSENYISLIPHEMKTVTVEAAESDLKGDKPLLMFDGWNIGVVAATTPDVDVALNDQALPVNSPVTHITIVQSHALKWPRVEFKINCGSGDSRGFQGDIGYDGGTANSTKVRIDVKTPNAAPMSIYQSERYGDFTYTIPVKLAPAGYIVRLHFVESKFSAAGQRKFNIDINGTSVLSDFDILSEAGAKDKAVVKIFSRVAPETDGNIHIRFYKGAADSAKIDGIEIVPSGS